MSSPSARREANEGAARAVTEAAAPLGALPVPRLWDPWACPAAALPALAWALSRDPGVTEVYSAPGNPELAAHYVQMHLAHKPHECFAVLFLDTQHRLICMETLFTGTLDQASVYPREVAARALLLRAASVVLAHNHPSGNPDPSAADIALTRRLQQALALLDISVLDHLIVAQGHAVSLAQRGLMPLA